MFRQTHFLFIPFSGETVVVGSPLKWKQRAVWHNTLRNRHVAELANGLSDKPRRRLRKLGLPVGKIPPSNRPRQRVVVLAETADHARRLERLLPTWELLNAVPILSYEPGWEPEAEDEYANPPPGRIATLMYVARSGIGCDILIRATGGTGPLDWNRIRGRGQRPGTRPTLVIDFADEIGFRGETEAKCRRREYREQFLNEIPAASERDVA